MDNKGYMVFFLPLLANLFSEESIDLTLLIVAISTCLVGSTMQVTHKNVEQKKKHQPFIFWVEIIAIYVTGVAFGFAAYFVGQKYELWIAMLVGTLGSYMSLDLFRGVKAAVLVLVKKLPDVLIKMYLNGKNERNS